MSHSYDTTQQKKGQQHCNCRLTATPLPGASSKWKATLKRNKLTSKAAVASNTSFDVIFIGDDAIEHLAGSDLGEQEEALESHAQVFDMLLNENDVNGMALGIAGDTTSQLLYRIQNGELPTKLQPKIVWIEIGTNNLSQHCTAEATLAGILAIVEELQKHLPSTIIVVNSILPRARNTIGTLAGILWTKIQWINTRLECFASNSARVEYFDASSIFIDKKGDGLVKRLYEKDWLYPSVEGTRQWGEAIVKVVEQLLVAEPMADEGGEEDGQR